MFGDATLVVGIASSITSLAAAGFAAFGVWYGSKRKAEVDSRVGDQAHDIQRTAQAQTVLMEVVDTMRAELKRQDDEHEHDLDHLRWEHDGALARERARRERDVNKLQAQIDTMSEDHQECLRRNEALERELADLKRG